MSSKVTIPDVAAIFINYNNHVCFFSFISFNKSSIFFDSGTKTGFLNTLFQLKLFSFRYGKRSLT